MSKQDKPKMDFDAGQGQTAGFDERQVQRESERRRVPFSTTLNAGLYEKLKTMAFLKEGAIADVVGEGVRRVIREKEEKRGEAYDPLRIDEDSS